MKLQNNFGTHPPMAILSSVGESPTLNLAWRPGGLKTLTGCPSGTFSATVESSIDLQMAAAPVWSALSRTISSAVVRLNAIQEHGG